VYSSSPAHREAAFFEAISVEVKSAELDLDLDSIGISLPRLILICRGWFGLQWPPS
jgi:hypothetical protein